MKATIGRIVHVLGFGDEAAPAIITAVHAQDEYDGDTDPMNYPQGNPLEITITAFPPMQTPQLANSVALFDTEVEARAHYRKGGQDGPGRRAAYWPERV